MTNTFHLRIVTADDEPRMRSYLCQSLERLGHQVVATASTGRELVEECRIHQPDLIISDIKMPDMDGIEAAGQIYRTDTIPVILVSAFHDIELIERASKNHILAYLVKPVKDTDLAPAIAVAMQRFNEFHELRQEAADARQALEDRKIIERAKGILMKRTGLNEPEAFRRLQKLACNKSRKLIDIARSVVTAEEALSSAENLISAENY
jgi:response regulator NasT